MSLDAFIDIIQTPPTEDWSGANQRAFEGLFGTEEGRYPRSAQKAVALRAPKMSSDGGIDFAAIIAQANPTSGTYSGLSFVMFPVDGKPCLIGLVVGTGGLSPDEAILGRPGHARKVRAICDWLNRGHGHGRVVAWAKQDPTRTDVQVPDSVRKAWPEYKSVFDRYGQVMYAMYCPSEDRAGTAAAAKAFLDLLFEERGDKPIKRWHADYEAIRSEWFEHLMPGVEAGDVSRLLETRRYVIIQGPPGTGKTRMAGEILRGEYGGQGRIIQFHPNTTYETFIGGLAPTTSTDQLGLRFSPVPGALMEAAAEAVKEPSKKYLLHIDEINRADLGKILGEAIFLLESGKDADRQVDLPYDFGEPFHRRFYLPDNLHILGTMNSADRSIAIVDVAVRRRFAFVSLWPRMSVVEAAACTLMQQMFREMLSIFVEHASEDAFALVPGHSYFLEAEDAAAKEKLKVTLGPLLEEYLAQGYVGGFAEPIRAYLQKLKSL